MKNTFGESVSVTLFGESHGAAIGAILDGMAPGIRVDSNFIRHQMDLRRSVASLSTARKEADEVEILSGIKDGITTGTPIAFMIKNGDTKSKDYESLKTVARPGHADYTAYCKYHGFSDTRGGGHFSGRITAGLVAAGAVAITALSEIGIYIGTHISKCAGVYDRDFNDYEEDIAALAKKSFAVLDENSAEGMRTAIESAKADGDSVGGVLETVVIGLPAGVGEPWFDTLESVLAHGIFAVPAVKGVEFGKGFAFSDMRGSEANDPFATNDGFVYTETNHNGGILGGISNGMPVLFRTAIKPTPSIYKTQNTVDFVKKENTQLLIHGRHDPAIVHRARVVIDSITALVLCDMLALRYGTDFLKNGGIKK
ncbi:MAG: chorismate synthase [Clostridia bacterium]|nr:chorismate synthase [Clostridia bacterium]